MRQTPLSLVLSPFTVAEARQLTLIWLIPELDYFDELSVGAYRLRHPVFIEHLIEERFYGMEALARSTPAREASTEAVHGWAACFVDETLSAGDDGYAWLVVV